MKNKIISRSGMSLAEVLITLGLIGAVAAITVPVVRTSMPDEYDALHKKAVYALEHAVADVVNNEDYYDVVETTVAGETTRHYGLKNTYAVTVNGNTYGTNTPATNPDAAKQKFCKIMASKFNIKSSVNCTVNRTFDDPTFETQDGVKWILPITDFSTANQKNVIAFYVAKDQKYKCGYLPAATKTEFFSNLNNSAIKAALWSDIKQSTDTYKDKYGIMTNEDDCKRPAVFIYAITPTGQLISPEANNDKIKTK